jgi:glycyl-tRNA synthetase beta chain
LADKLDTIAAFFAINEKPTGSKDPFALRRAALGIISTILDNGLRSQLSEVVCEAVKAVEEIPYVEALVGAASQTHAEVDYFTKLASGQVLDFFADRLKVQQREAGVRHDLIDAVFAAKNQDGAGEDDLVRLLARVRALQAFIGTEDGANLHAGYRRAANILRKEDWRGIEGEIALTGEEDPLALVDDPDLAPVIAAKMAEKHAKDPSYTSEPAESALSAALDSAEPDAAAAIEAEDFERAMRALASLRAPIDRYFDSVTVNDADPNKRAARLDLLARFRAAVHNVADLARIEG